MSEQEIFRYLNALSPLEMKVAIRKCCNAESWVLALVDARPFSSDAHMKRIAAQIWSALPEASWLEAFGAHPRIGDVGSLRERFSNTKEWAGREQSQVSQADDATIHRLATTNERYFEKFGFIFIVCATGKSAEEMLANIESRISNERSAEIEIAAAEQWKIALLRIGKLLT